MVTILCAECETVVGYESCASNLTGKTLCIDCGDALIDERERDGNDKARPADRAKRDPGDGDDNDDD